MTQSVDGSTARLSFDALQKRYDILTCGRSQHHGDHSQSDHGECLFVSRVRFGSGFVKVFPHTSQLYIHP